MDKFLSMAGPLARLTTALMVGVAVPGTASAQSVPDMYQTSGVLGVFGGVTSVDSNEFPGGDSWLLGGEARVNIWLTERFSAQFDIVGETGKFDEDGVSAETRHNIATGGHLSWRYPEMYALGIFGGVAEGTILNNEGNETRYFLGLEGQYYLNDFTLYGQAGFSDLISGDDGHAEMVDAWFVRGVGRWFVTPNDKIEGEVGFYYAGDLQNSSPNGPSRTYNWGALYEHQFASSPFSAYAEYNGLKREDDSHDSNHTTEHIFLIGARINLQQPDLKTADRYGATFDLPDVIRTENWADLTH
jgi:hypothetical protein